MDVEKKNINTQFESYKCSNAFSKKKEPVSLKTANKMVALIQENNSQLKQQCDKAKPHDCFKHGTSISTEMPPVKTKYSIVLMHGLYESPVNLKHTQEMYASMGFNVINLRLPGHGTKDNKVIKKIKWQDWDKKMKQALKLAEELGDKVIVHGHSTGGLLAHKAMLDYSNSPKNNTKIHGLITSSPSLKISDSSKIKAYGGTFLNTLGLNKLTESISKHPPEPGIEVNKLSHYLQKKYSPTAYNYVADPYADLEDTENISDDELEDASIKEIYGKVKNIPILQIGSDHDSVVVPEYNNKVMKFLKTKTNALNISPNKCFDEILKNYNIYAATMYHDISSDFLKFKKSLLVNTLIKAKKNKCAISLQKEQLQVLEFIDKNFPGRCD